MTMTMTLPIAAHQRRPDTRELLPLEEYDVIICSYSGGKDGTALVLHLLEEGVDPKRIQLWHQDVDGDGSTPFMDWPCTPSYVRAVGRALGIRTLFQYRIGGFEGEMLKKDARTAAVRFELQDGGWGQAGGVKGKVSTRHRFPQATADLRVRWCSASLKIDVAALALNNDAALKAAKILFLTGERREEGKNGTGRALYAECEPHRCDSQRRRVDAWRAVIDWGEAQVWAIMRRWRIRPHPAYRLSFPRVSCLACIFGGADQWASVRKLDPVRFARILAYERQFGCTIKEGADVEVQANKGTPYPETANAYLVSLGMTTQYPMLNVRVGHDEDWELPPGAFKKGGGPG
jgi:3'-phosphoadenosine 5'-phosphosulfate sulfotransferase (PAPS reductase)/FAD synthetase